jgi:hypothetical protein
MTAAKDDATPIRSVVDDIIAARTIKYQDASVFMDGEAWSEAEALRLQALEARQAEKVAGSVTDEGAYPLRSAVPALEDDLEGALERLKASKVTFRFEALPAIEYDDLVAAHPSDDDDYAWDLEAFPLALIAASCRQVTGPGIGADHLTLGEVERLEKELDKAQFGGLFAAALQVQTRPAEPFTYAATGPTSSSGSRSTIASNRESRTPGS